MAGLVGASELLQGPLATAAGLVIGVVGLIAAVVFYYRPARRWKPYFARRDTNLIRGLSGEFSGLEVFFEKTSIANFTSSRITFWNGGRGTLDRAQVAEGNPVEVRFSQGATILALKVIHAR